MPCDAASTKLARTLAIKQKSKATTINEGLELEVSLVATAICPTDILIDLAQAFQEKYPSVPLRIQTEVMEDVAKQVIMGTSQIGIIGPIKIEDDSIQIVRVSTAIKDRALIETIQAEKIKREHRFRLSADGQQLQVQITIVTSKLSKPIQYELTYQRQNK